MSNDALKERLKREGVEHRTPPAETLAKFRKMVDESFHHLSEEERHIEAYVMALTHPDSPYARKPVPETSQNLIPWLKAIIILLGILVLLSAASLKAHAQKGTSQIDVITIQNGGTTVKSFAAPFKLNCGTNMTCGVSGSTLTLTSSGGGAATGYQTIQNAAAAIAQETTLNWTAGIVCADNAGASRSDCALANIAAVAHKFFNSVVSGALVLAQPACADLSDAGTACTAVAPANTTATAHNFFTAYTSATGAFTKAQPVCADLSDASGGCTMSTTAGGDLSGTLPSPTVAAVNGTTVPTNAAADQVIVTTSSAVGAWKSVTNCGDATHALAYSTSTHTFSCQAITASASAGGSNTQVQYNNSGSLAGITNMTSDGTNVTKLSAGAGPFDLTAATITKLRVASGLTTSANGDIGQSTTDGVWHFWFNGSDRLVPGATNKGAAGQLLQSNGDGTYTNADPIVSLNYVNLWTAQDVTVTRTSSTVRVSNFGAYGTLFLTWAGITGSPSGCTVQVKSSDSAGNLINNGSALSASPANGSTSQVFSGAATLPTQAQMGAVFACSVYPSAGTLTLDFVPAQVTFSQQLPAALDGSGFLKTHEQGTAAISAAALPLPSGAAQDSSLTTLDTDVKANITLHAGTNVIGHVIADTGSTTAVTGNVAVTKADGSDVTLGAKADAAATQTDTTPISAISILKEISAKAQAPASTPVTGTFWQSTQPVSAATLPLPSGAATDASLTADPCGPGHAKSYAIYDASTNGSTQLVGLVNAKIVYVCSYAITSSSTTANTIKLVYGTGTACATGQTAITPGLVVQAVASSGPAGKVVPNSAGLQTIASNELCVVTNAAQAAQVEVAYVQQ